MDLNYGELSLCDDVIEAQTVLCQDFWLEILIVVYATIDNNDHITQPSKTIKWFRLTGGDLY